MPWKECVAMDQRMRFVLDYERDEQTMAELCRKYGVSRKTGYKWVGRFVVDGLDGLKDRSRRPLHRPNQVSPEIEELLCGFRAAHPTWGPKKLLAVLQREHPERPWPARSTVAVLLSRRGLAHCRKRRHRVPPQQQPFAACEGPNAVWCADFKGWFRTGDGSRCDPLPLTDAYSRFLLRCQIVPDQGGQTVWPLFEAALRQYGLPAAIRTDNGAPFASRGVGGIRRLSLRWIKLGIRPERIEPGQPQQNGRHERMHLTLKQETASPPAGTLRSQQRRFDAFRREFNEVRPHEALGMATPSSRYVPSPRAYRECAGDVAYPEGLALRRIGTKGKFKWKGHELFLGEVLYREVVGLEALDERYWRAYFGPVALGILDDHERRMLSRAEVRRRGLALSPSARRPPSATLQGASGQEPNVLPMSLD